MPNSVWGSFGATSPSREMFATETFAVLRTYTNPRSDANVSIAVDGGITKGDGLGGIFYYDPSSVLPDDNINVISPASAIGRWIRRDQSAPGINQYRKNAIINGGMEIAQRGTNFPAIVSGTYSLDRWIYQKAGTMIHTVSQDTDVPTVAQAGQLFLNSIRLNLTTPQAIIGVNDYTLISQLIEGYNWRALAQRIFTLSFWVKATLPGIYCVAFQNSVSDRAYTDEFTINASNIWEKKTITLISPSPSTGTWNYTTGLGLIFRIVLACGTANQGIKQNWNLPVAATANQINGVQGAALDFRITGVQLEAGNVASEFERRTIQEELQLCQRYYQKTFAQGITPIQNIGVNTGEQTFPIILAGAVAGHSSRVALNPTMRIAPNIIFYNPLALNAQARDIINNTDCSATVVQAVRDSGFRIDFTGNAGSAAGNLAAVHWTADAEI